MPLVNMKDMLEHAYQHMYAVGGFDLVSLDFLEAILLAAEDKRSPVILSLAESHFAYYDFELAMAATEAASRRATVPVAIHLDHGASQDSAVRAINLGCNGVMVDASHQAFSQNVAITKAVVDMAHACGVPVEGELGYVAGAEGEDAEKHPGELVFTAPDEAIAYVKQTGVDFLAVSVGTVHGRLRGTAQLDLERLAQINQQLGIPLVIHGGTGLSDAQFRELIANGVSKINYYTALADAAAEQIRHNSQHDNHCGYTGLLKNVQQAISAEVGRCIELFGSANKAQDVLRSAQVCQSVEHVIIYNAETSNHAQVEEMMARGRDVLSRIPGVRRVITGNALKQEARYQFCWLVEFAHPNVIASYRDHPQHQAFADELFRPLASDRISIDYSVAG